MSVDEKCWQLAEHFLSDDNLDKHTLAIQAGRLAQAIQSAVEAWLEDRDIDRGL